MTTEFTDLNLHPQLVQAVVELGYLAPTPIQAAMIPVMLTGQDVLGQAQTGTGKTAAFALPILHNLVHVDRQVQSLVLVPTRELALQVAQAFASLGRHSQLRVLPVYGGQAYGPQISQIRRGVDILVGTPGRILDLIRKEILNLQNIRTLVLDEADEMLSMGFIEDIETILAATPAKRQTALFSATLPSEIRRLADKHLRDPQAITIQGTQITLTAIQQRYYWVNHKDKLAALTRLFETEEVGRTLIFVRTRLQTGEVANELTRRGFPAEALNGDLTQDMREQTLLRFRQSQIKVLVATDVAARGLDIDDVSHVFNFDLPDDPGIYVHRIGRTGRAGKSGIAISLVSPSDKRHLRQVEAYTRQKLEKADLPSEGDILKRREEELIRKVVVWLQRGRCLRERELVEKLAAEGHDILQIAAAALKLARAEDKQRPIAAVSQAPEIMPERFSHRSDLGNRATGFRGIRTVSHEPGMIRLSLNLGKKHGVLPRDIVGAIAAHAEIPGSSIGKILIEDGHTLVDVPEGFATKVLAKTGSVWIRRQAIAIQLAG